MVSNSNKSLSLSFSSFARNFSKHVSLVQNTTELVFCPIRGPKKDESLCTFKAEQMKHQYIEEDEEEEEEEEARTEDVCFDDIYIARLT
jgi:hypothetical protein